MTSSVQTVVSISPLTAIQLTPETANEIVSRFESHGHVVVKARCTQGHVVLIIPMADLMIHENNWILEPVPEPGAMTGFHIVGPAAFERQYRPSEEVSVHFPYTPVTQEEYDSLVYDHNGPDPDSLDNVLMQMMGSLHRVGQNPQA